MRSTNLIQTPFSPPKVTHNTGTLVWVEYKYVIYSAVHSALFRSSSFKYFCATFRTLQRTQLIIETPKSIYTVRGNIILLYFIYSLTYEPVSVQAVWISLHLWTWPVSHLAVTRMIYPVSVIFRIIKPTGRY